MGEKSPGGVGIVILTFSPPPSFDRKLWAGPEVRPLARVNSTQDLTHTPPPLRPSNPHSTNRRLYYGIRVSYFLK